jgi:hypothetical protein
MPKSTALPMSPQGEPDAASKKNATQLRQAAVRAGILKGLGLPAQLFRLDVLPLWGNHFRVNVVTGPDASAVQIPNSFFVTTDDSGNIVGSTPSIQKQY